MPCRRQAYSAAIILVSEERDLVSLLGCSILNHVTFFQLRLILMRDVEHYQFPLLLTEIGSALHLAEKCLALF